ncbi:hypothetical protein K458DRAFT_386923 [Lentithecium fluviatile CBS 122367]|uniref:Uncharacterized protein n=1 Tax=Lentithecium fluviatile CBS 122367 TaxID=1168545 RepID=A0A6G1J9Z2_9PLEO|nr:hypothetical protein K458DRAFT_386923 [Lentithecium fluviatile CBS 122367]
MPNTSVSKDCTTAGAAGSQSSRDRGMKRGLNDYGSQLAKRPHTIASVLGNAIQELEEEDKRKSQHLDSIQVALDAHKTRIGKLEWNLGAHLSELHKQKNIYHQVLVERDISKARVAMLEHTLRAMNTIHGRVMAERNASAAQVAGLRVKVNKMETQACKDKAKIETLLEENRVLAEKVAKAKAKESWKAFQDAGAILDA